jgi:cell wall-associated NlpC family hydrolase
VSNTVHHTHRRAMRTVTPVSRAGRVGAGAAMAAAMLFGGAAAATAEPQTEAPQADAPAASAVIPAVAAPAVGIPAANASDDEKEAEPALAPAPESTISVQSAAQKQAEREAAEQAQREAAEQAEREAAEQERAAAEQDAQQQDDSGEQTESRQDDSSETSSRSGERSQREDDSEGQQDSGSSESSSSEKEEKSSPAPSAGKGSSILATARSGIGTPYVYGGTSTSGWDCSGFVQWVYAQHGINLPRGAADQAAAGTVIPRSEAQPGDLVYKPGHVGIYAGGNKFVDAGNKRVGTSERNIYSGSWTFIRIGG